MHLLPPTARQSGVSNEWERRPRRRGTAKPHQKGASDREISDVADLFGSVRFFRMEGGWEGSATLHFFLPFFSP